MLALWNLLKLVEHSLQPTFCSYTQLFWAAGPRWIQLILAQRRQGSWFSSVVLHSCLCSVGSVSAGSVRIAFIVSVMCQNIFLKIFFMFIFVYECLHVCICAMSVPGPNRGRKRLWMPWNWSYIQMIADYHWETPGPLLGRQCWHCWGSSQPWMHHYGVGNLSPVICSRLPFRLVPWSQKATHLCYCGFTDWCSQGFLEKPLAPSYHTFMRFRKRRPLWPDFVLQEWRLVTSFFTFG